MENFDLKLIWNQFFRDENFAERVKKEGGIPAGVEEIVFLPADFEIGEEMPKNRDR